MSAALSATQYDTELKVVVEKWHGRMPSWAGAIGLGKQLGKFLETVELNLGVKERHVLFIDVSDWRNDVYTLDQRRACKGGGSAAWKALAADVTGISQHDAAEAVLIGLSAVQRINDGRIIFGTTRKAGTGKKKPGRKTKAGARQAAPKKKARKKS